MTTTPPEPPGYGERGGGGAGEQPGYGGGPSGQPGYGEVGYGTPPAYGTPPGYGGQPGYGAPPGYGAQPAYGAPPAAYGTQPAYGGPPAAPPGLWAGPPLAEWQERIGATFIDGLILTVPFVILVRLSVGMAWLTFIVVWLYLQYLHGTTGQTVGKKILKITLLREQDGRPVGAGLAVGRALLHVVDAAPCGLGFLWPLWDGKKQTFADKIVTTVVIKA